MKQYPLHYTLIDHLGFGLLAIGQDRGGLGERLGHVMD